MAYKDAGLIISLCRLLNMKFAAISWFWVCGLQHVLSVCVRARQRKLCADGGVRDVRKVCFPLRKLQSHVLSTDTEAMEST